MFERNKELKEKIMSLLTDARYNNVGYCATMGDGLCINKTLLANCIYENFSNIGYRVSLQKDTFGQIVEQSIHESKPQKAMYCIKFDDTIEKVNDVVLSVTEGTYLIPTDFGLIAFYMINNNTIGCRVISGVVIMTWDKGYLAKLTEYITENMKLVECKKNTGNNKYKLAYSSSYGIATKDMPFKPVECDIKKSYNDDLPYDRIIDLLNEDRQQLIMFYGDPGTGKTTLIKKIINDNPDKTSVVVDSNLLTTIGDDRFLNFVSNNTDTIFVLEDCDKILQSREKGNQTMSTILNLTDGLIGEAFNIKFICTFNTSMKDVDKAIFRKGRLSLMYEFKPLCLEKTKAFIPNATKPMTLAEIFHPDDNKTNDKSKTKIGF